MKDDAAEEITRPDLDLAWIEANLTLDGHPIREMLTIHARNTLRRDRALARHGIHEAGQSLTTLVVTILARLTTIVDRKLFLASVGSSVSRADFLDQCVAALDSISQGQ